MIAYAATTVDQLPGQTTTQLTGFVETIIASIPLWITAFVVVLITFLIAKIVRSEVESKLTEKGVEDDNKDVVALWGRVAYAIVLTIGVTAGLKIAGIDLTVIIAAVGFGLGFALQDLIMNFISGIMLLLNRQFAIGDFIKVAGTAGKVLEIQSRVTIIKAFDGTKVIVPNADLFKNVVTSFTTHPFRRVEVDVCVDYRGNLENALRVVMHAVKQTKGALAEPKPAVLIGTWGDSNINIKVRVWTESKNAWQKFKSKLMLNISKAYDEYGIPFAWNIAQVMYDKDLNVEEKTFVSLKEKRAAKAAAEAAAQAQIQAQIQAQPVQVQQVQQVVAQPAIQPIIQTAIQPQVQEVQVTSVTPVVPMIPVQQEVKAEYQEPQPLKPLGEI